jgi:exopolyphosphatase / guanosine-5'-triphosphate,3'-diphosphate pyrophosphatase
MIRKDLRASVDIGSNSVLLLIAEVQNGKLIELVKRSEITQLGKELDKNKAFHPESINATFDALKSYAKDCEAHGVKAADVIVTATEASRVAGNAPAFFKKVSDEIGLNIQIITPEAEAYYSTRGILYNSKFESEVITIMDIGGASTELIKVNTKNFQIQRTISMPVGAVRATQWLTDGTFVQSLQKLFLDYRTEIDEFQTRELFCVAGTMTSLGNMHLQRKEFVEDDLHGMVMKSEDVDNLFKKFSDTAPETFLEEFPFLQKRSQNIRGGLHVAYHFIHRLLAREITISTYGLRYGTILEGKIKKEHLWKAE